MGHIDLLGRSSPPVVVLCPSHDLCKQVLDVAMQLDPSNQLIKQWLDGPSLGSDKNVFTSPRIRWGATDIVVSTPLKFYEDLERFRQDNLKPATIVFDEADFLFQGSTQGAVLDILSYIRPKPGKRITKISGPLVQCVFASATMPDIGKWTISPMLIQRFMTAEVVKTSGFHSIPTSIRSIEWVPELEANWDNRCYLLTQQLSRLFETHKSSLRVLVFVNTQHNASVLYTFLKDKKWPVTLFKKGKDGQSLDDNPLVIVATDAGARGMDWNGGVEAVINFQMPTDVVTWLHRAGRCGRLNKSGSVVSFFKQQEQDLIELLKNRISNRATVDSLFSYKRSLRRRLRHPSPS
jgi:superfamily II DNA/RNA helicase